MAISSLNEPDPWGRPRRVFNSDGTFSYRSPSQQYGHFNPAGFGDFERVRLMATEVTRMDGSHWAAAGMERLETLRREMREHREGANAAFFSLLKPFEQQLEAQIRARLDGTPEQLKAAENEGSRLSNGGSHGAAPPASPRATGAPAAPAARPVADAAKLAEISDLLGTLFYCGVTWRLDPVGGGLSYFANHPGIISPEERALLQDYWSDVKTIIEGRPSLHVRDVTTGGRPILPSYPAEAPAPVAVAEEDVSVVPAEPTEAATVALPEQAQNLEEIPVPAEPPVVKTKKAHAVRLVQLSSLA